MPRAVDGRAEYAAVPVDRLVVKPIVKPVVKPVVKHQSLDLMNATNREASSDRHIDAGKTRPKARTCKFTCKSLPVGASRRIVPSRFSFTWKPRITSCADASNGSGFSSVRWPSFLSVRTKRQRHDAIFFTRSPQFLPNSL
jgi:hypothetical protein